MTPMTPIQNRAFAEAQDRVALRELLWTVRAEAGADRYPTRFRLELLLSSRLADPAHDVRVWGDNHGNLLGCAALLQHAPDSATASLEFVKHPAWAAVLEEEMLAWGQTWAAERQCSHGTAMTLSVGACEDESAKRALLLRRGFAPQTAVHNVYFVRSLHDMAGDQVPSPPVPDGYVVRPLRGVEELEAYEALFSFAPMRRQHRLALLQEPGYQHLVLVASDGTFAAFVECSTDTQEWARGGRRTGWIDYIGTSERLRGTGLGRAVLNAGLRWMRQQGAAQAALVTMSTNAPAHRLYTSMGFHEAAKETVYVFSGAPLHDITEQRSLR